MQQVKTYSDISGGSGLSASPAIVSSPDGVFNCSSNTFKNWRKVVAKVRDGSGRGKVLIISDSTGMGTGGGTGGTGLTGGFAKSWPKYLSTLFNTYFVSCSYNSFFGDQSTNAVIAYNTYDPRVTLGSGWAFAVDHVIGGFLINYTTGSASTLAFLPTSNVDTFTLYYVRNTGHGSYAVNVNGGATLATINANGAPALLTSTVTASIGSNTLNLVAANDATFFLQGVLSYNSNVPAIDIINGSAFGASAGNYTLGPDVWNPIQSIPTLAPDLTIICLTINDSNGSTANATYKSQMQALITACQTTGDVLLMVGAPSNSTNATNGTLDGLVQILTGLASLNNVGLLNIKARWQSYAVTNAILPYFAFNHPGSLGYQDIAQAVFGVLSQV